MPIAFTAEPPTVTSASGASTSLSNALTNTVPALVVEPAPIVSVAPPDTSNPPDDEPATVTVVADDDGCDNDAVTRVSPPFSEIDDGFSVNAAPGGASSSGIVSVTFDGAATPLPPAAVADTVTDLFGASVSLFTAVIVTTPTLVVSPAAMVSFVPVCVKSVPDPGDAETVTVTASLDAPDSVAVTVDTPPFSEIDEDDNASETVGRLSSSVVVTATSTLDSAL